MSVVSRFVVVGAVVAASMSVAVPAQAAKACVLGKWRGTSYLISIKGPAGETYGKGAKGVRLTITRTSAVYNFDKSTKETLAGYGFGELTFTSWYKYTKTLRVKATVKGSKKGTIVLKAKTATGNASSTGAQTWPEHLTYPKASMAKSLRKGTAESVVPVKSSFACSGKTLKLYSSYKYKGYTISVGRVFTRA